MGVVLMAAAVAAAAAVVAVPEVAVYLDAVPAVAGYLVAVAEGTAPGVEAVAREKPAVADVDAKAGTGAAVALLLTKGLGLAW